MKNISNILIMICAIGVDVMFNSLFLYLVYQMGIVPALLPWIQLPELEAYTCIIAVFIWKCFICSILPSQSKTTYDLTSVEAGALLVSNYLTKICWIIVLIALYMFYN